MTTTTPDDARSRGYESLTQPYHPKETTLLQSAVLQLAGANIILVKLKGGGIEIWRLKRELVSLDGISASQAGRVEHFGSGRGRAR